MIVVDTNVVSEPIKPEASPAVVAWLDRQVTETLYLTSTSLAELLVGVEAMPAGRRKEAFQQALTEIVAKLFESRILSFDEQAAVRYASLVARARAAGRQIAVADGQIAAIAAVHGFAVATRDVEPFRAAGVPVINPWEESSPAASR
jgi:toxin FitB